MPDSLKIQGCAKNWLLFAVVFFAIPEAWSQLVPTPFDQVSLGDVTGASLIISREIDVPPDTNEVFFSGSEPRFNPQEMLFSEGSYCSLVLRPIRPSGLRTTLVPRILRIAVDIPPTQHWYKSSSCPQRDCVDFFMSFVDVRFSVLGDPAVSKIWCRRNSAMPALRPVSTVYGDQTNRLMIPASALNVGLLRRAFESFGDFAMPLSTPSIRR